MSTAEPECSLERQWPLEVHGKRAEIAYCDGHVESKRRLDMIGQLQKDVGAQQNFDLVSGQTYSFAFTVNP